MYEGAAGVDSLGPEVKNPDRDFLPAKHKGRV